MVKLYLDANGLAPIAEALSGQSKLAGVAAGLRNQMLGGGDAVPLEEREENIVFEVPKELRIDAREVE